ncbi:hypothetical protein Aph01nite_29240 [Acrocarpospora phusangensis]|uniref:Uncharacterized protein n=2 Tax=Acrocarpospora phusangensis TaxID=1070424 RepID=A0A919Q8T3_9ACTN|nr:hypothetical protein Aph01nite_29240 [Acrocarpospora phusangensis]
MAPDGGFNAPPSQLIWQPGLVLGWDPAQLDTAFTRSRLGLVSISRGFAPQQNVVVVVGDAAEDFALAHVYRRLYGRGIWLPNAWLASNAVQSMAIFGLRSTLSKHVLRGGKVIVATTSLEAPSIDVVLSELRQPTFWSEGDHERLAKQFEEHVLGGAVTWPTDRMQYSAVDGQFDQDYAIPIKRNEAGDVEMAVICPPPAINQPELAGSANLHWQVDVELIETVSPRGRGLDGHAVLAEGQDPYLTWVRNGRDGIVYESERFNFIAAGTSPVSRLARPRLRVPGLARWADLMARQADRRMRFSAAGRRVEVMRQLWGDRATLASQFAGPMLPVLRKFRPTAKKSTLALSEANGDVLATGAGQHLWEAYLTFSGVLHYGEADKGSTQVFREQVDEMLTRGILRRGLILGCELCGRPAFLEIGDLAQMNRCPRCSAANSLSQARWRKPEDEPQWYYDLHPTVREHLAQDGEIPLLLSHHLRSGSREYNDAAELELSDDSGPLAECDLVALRDGKIITAEAKRTGSLGEGKTLRQAIAKRALLAEQIQADQILLATTDAKWQQASVDALRQEIRQRPWTMPAPQARLICGLGTATVTDMELDAETGLLTPWPKDR